MTVSLRDFDGTTRLEGDLLATGGATGDVLTQQADGTYEPAPGGSQPTQSTYHGNAVTIGNFGGFLTWDALDDGVELLDRTDPAAPLFLADGVYSLLVQYAANGALNAGGFVQPSVLGGFSYTMATSNKPDFVTAFSLTFLAAAGQQIQLSIQSHNGGDELDYSLTQAVLVKIT